MLYTLEWEGDVTELMWATASLPVGEINAVGCESVITMIFRCSTLNVAVSNLLHSCGNVWPALKVLDISRVVERHLLFCPGRGAEYCDQFSVCLRLSVCP